MTEVTPMAVSKAARSVLTEFLARKEDLIYQGAENPTPWHINCGLCEDFAEAIMRKLGVQAGNGMEVIWLNETLLHDDTGPVAFDHEILKRLGITLPENHSEDDVFQIVSNINHAVLLYSSEKYGVRFYDSQALQGVPSYFDLPLVKDAIGILKDPSVVSLQSLPSGDNHDALLQAASDYFQRCSESRIEDYQSEWRISDLESSCEPAF